MQHDIRCHHSMAMMCQQSCFVLVKGSSFWRIDIDDNLPWKLERIMWIGYHKNIENQQCFVSKLPKTVLDEILDNLRAADAQFQAITKRYH